MEPDAHAPGEIRLPFEPGDRFIQVHANGAILVVADDYQWNLASLGQAVAVALEAVEHGTRVLLGHEVLDDRTTAVLESVRRTGATVVDFGTVIPPMTWPQGTTPLMTAAAQGRNDLIEDLLARGLPADATDDTGATALHHAAHAGNQAGATLLVAAGLDPGQVDGEGRTPARLARLAGHATLAEQLRPDGDDGTAAEPAASARDEYGWRGSARLVLLWVGVVGVVVLFTATAVSRADLWSAPLLGVVGLVVWTQRHLLRAGGPLRLRGGVLELVTLTGVRRLPVGEVRGVAFVPPRGVNGAPGLLALCQDRLGPTTTPARLRALGPRDVTPDDAERLAGVAGRHVVVVLGRGRHTDRVLASLVPALRGASPTGNHWWSELARTLP